MIKDLFLKQHGTTEGSSFINVYFVVVVSLKLQRDNN